ncbi:MAG: SDR family oxidoreductase [Myxococcales bacterium]|nr:SDR family oxidoreductase [Myxococcales bacterium]MDD9970495.1 SDR family oxidoreductase [Myxococcales bacterium]
MSKILVTAATGTIGRKLIRQLQASGIPFRALVRSHDKGAALGCEYAVGDFDQPATLEPALEGIDALFLNGPGGEPLLRQQIPAIERARAAGVKRIVKLSARGADAKSGFSRFHGQVERVLVDSGVAWSVLRPGSFMQNLLRNAAVVRKEGRFYGAYKDGRVALVDAEDIAACGLLLLRNDDHEGQVFTLSGPEALSFSEIASKLGKTLGKHVTYEDLAPEQMVAKLKSQGTPSGFAQAMVGLMVGYSTGAGAEVTSAISDLLGRPARNYDQFFADNVSAFR